MYNTDNSELQLANAGQCILEACNADREERHAEHGCMPYEHGKVLS